MSVPIAVPDGGPLFDGHFPGRPILPGIALLALIVRAIDPASRDASVRAIPYLRFRALVQSGDALELHVLSPGPDGRLQFDLKRRGVRVANGALALGPPVDAEDETPVLAARLVRDAPAIDDLILHRPPIRFVEKILDEAEDGMTCLARVPHACALVDGGATPAFVALEAAAQTAAVWEAVRRARGGGAVSPRLGYLVSASDVTLQRRTIPAEADLVASVRLEAWMDPLVRYAVQVSMDGTVVLSGTIGTYMSD